MNKKILIIGNGIAEYALARKLSERYDIYVAPGSDSLKEFTTCLDIRENNVSELLEFAMENEIDMTIATSEKAIQADIAEQFIKNKLQIFAPTQKSSELICNKTLAKKTLYKLRIPTPKFGIFEKLNIANDYIKNQSLPFVIKTNDKNSATIVTSINVGKRILETVFAEKNKKVIIEDYKYGIPFSFYAVTDGYKAIPVGHSLSYKHLLDGNGGQLTGGMGACVPNYKLSVDNEYYIMDNVIYPTIDYLQQIGHPYLGILGVNGILGDDGTIFILGWQSFLQDYDADGILNCIDEDLYNLFESCIIGSFSDEIDSINYNNNQSVSLVLSCRNKDSKENAIKGTELVSDNTLISYYPSVKRNKYMEFEASYGPVLVLTSIASSIAKSREIVYSDVNDIDFAGKFYRKDICKLSIH